MKSLLVSLAIGIAAMSLLVAQEQPAAPSAQNYSARSVMQDGVQVVHLHDNQRGQDVAVVPSLGNRGIAFTTHGKNIIYFPYDSPGDFAKRPDLNGIPFLAPWANRLDGNTYWVNNHQYRLNPNLGNFQVGNAGLPLHGLLQASNLWKIGELASDANSAWVVSHLNFTQYPELMEQFPFAQEYEIEYKLSNGRLEVRTTIRNHSAEPIPVSIGFHPYYRIPDKPRDQWTLAIPARKSIVVDERRVPTGEVIPVTLPPQFSLQNRPLDDGVTDLQRDSNNLAHFTIASGSQQIEITFGPKYPVAVIWNPAGQPFVCVEPMAAPTNGINLAHAGKYPGLQYVQPNASWAESFFVTPKGF